MTNINEIERLENKAETIRMIINNWKQAIPQYEAVLSALIEEINKQKKQVNNNENMNDKINKNNTLNGGINTK